MAASHDKLMWLSKGKPINQQLDKLVHMPSAHEDCEKALLKADRDFCSANWPAGAPRSEFCRLKLLAESSSVRGREGIIGSRLRRCGPGSGRRGCG